MAKILGDNTVIPSYMGTRRMGRALDTGDLTNTSLREGEVKDIIYPDNERSQSKKFIEYTVEVQHRDGSGPGTSSVYEGCVISNLFGGAADVFRYTLRKDDSKKVGEDGIGVGSKVLIQCVNGMTGQAVIVGGARDLKADPSTVESAADGHNLLWEFNGVSLAVDKEGQAHIKMRGPTDVYGTVTAPPPKPTAIDLLANGDWILDCGASITAQCTDKSFIKSAGLEIGAATDNMLLASTYRQSETQLHNKLIGQLTALATQLGIAGGSITAATIPMKIPVVGPIIASGILTPAGTALTAAVNIVLQMVKDLTAFEARAADYLSRINKND